MGDRLNDLIDEIREFVRERDWAQFHDPKNLAMLVASEVGELLAEYRWVPNSQADAQSSNSEAKARIEAEAADVAISLLLLFDRLGLDPIDAIRKKLQVNARNYPPDVVRGQPDRRSDAPSVASAQGGSKTRAPR
jgi:NTP pyrophosphatase (non-canonical NTP hydrolase)